MNAIEAKRFLAAEFIRILQTHVKEFLESDQGWGFSFARNVHRSNHKIRDMIGYLPIVDPENFYLEGEFVGIKQQPGRRFVPTQLGVPISSKVWQALNVPHTQQEINEPELSRQATFEQVSTLWERVAQRYESGELDDELSDITAIEKHEHTK